MIEEEKPRKMAIVVSEGSFDKAMMPMILATTGATMGMETHVFFTFFGLNLLKKNANPKLAGLYRLFTGVFKKRMKKIGVEDFQAIVSDNNAAWQLLEHVVHHI